MSQAGVAAAVQRPILKQSSHVRGRQALRCATACSSSVFDFAWWGRRRRCMNVTCAAKWSARRELRIYAEG